MYFTHVYNTVSVITLNALLTPFTHHLMLAQSSSTPCARNNIVIELTAYSIHFSEARWAVAAVW